jgi:hypothetical protein
VTDLPDYSTEENPPPIHLPSLPALTTLIIELREDDPLPYLKTILCSIGSAPVLTYIAIGYDDWDYIENLPFEGPWVDVDRWLSRIAEHTKVKGSLALTLRGWPEGKLIWEGFFPEFRESGGEIKVDHSPWRPRWHPRWQSSL